MVISNNFYSKIKTKILFLAQIAVLAYCKKYVLLAEIKMPLV